MSNPSAPPDPDDDFEWINKLPNKNVYPVLDNNNNDNIQYTVLDDNNNQPPAQPSQPSQPQPSQPKEHQTPNPQDQGFQAPSDMAVPDAITQQLIYQKIMEQQKKKKQDAANKAILEEKQQNIPTNITQPPIQQSQQPQIHNLNQPKPSYMDQDVQYPETSLYKAAGICIWRQKPNGKGIQFMMGLEKTNNSLAWFGGKRDQNDKSPVDTALREFHQQTGKVLDDETLQQIRRMLKTDNDRKLFWKKEWFSYLFFYQMSYDYDIVLNYSKNKGMLAEMKQLYWIDFEKIYKSICINGNLVKIGKNKNSKYPLRSFIVGMFLHSKIRNYLLNLHIGKGGNINGVKPRNGGTIRSTLDVFTTIPKIIRLDIINPITHNLLYYRWIDSSITDIDDYQLLTSLITSICPEIGCNFQLYYCNNKPFKTSAKQYVIDTIPSFVELKKYIQKKQKQYLTNLVILPTIILSDNFKGISFSFKTKDVSWKKINLIEYSNGNVSKLWNGNNNNNDDDDKKNDNNNNAFGQNIYWNDNDSDDDNINWKWQFQNDNQKFEDYSKKNNKKIEKAFMSGCTFIGYKRKTVPYQANFMKMMQKNLNTQKMRAIRRVPGNVKSAPSDKNSNNNNVIPFNNYYYQSPAHKYYKWQYQDDDGYNWADYDVNISKQLNSFKISWDNNINNYHYTFYRSKKRFDSHYTKTITIKANNKMRYTYLIDIKHFRQQNTTTKNERNVRQIPCYDHKYNNNLIALPYFMNNNNIKLKYKWQYKDDGYNNWKDYNKLTSIYIEKQFKINPYSTFTVNINNNKQYSIQLGNMQQMALLSNKYRSIRRVPLYEQFGGGIKHKWEWKDDDNKWKLYNKITSNQIESACNSGIKKYFFVSSKNNNSYEINFNKMNQYNVQTGKQRKVRKIQLKPSWKGNGQNPDKYRGPINIDRKTFNKKIISLYCVVGDNINTEIFKSGKFIRATLGPFGTGLYWYNSDKLAKEMAKNKNISMRGNLINAKIFIGKEKDVSNMNDKQYDFITLQKLGFDSVSRYIGIGKEYIVYNNDQICIIKQQKYYN